MPEFTDRLAIPIPPLGATDWRGDYVAAFQIIDNVLGRIVDAGGVAFVRRYDGSWPARGDLPEGASVIWVKPDPQVPDPSIGGTGLLEDFDLVVVATT